MQKLTVVFVSDKPPTNDRQRFLYPDPLPKIAEVRSVALANSSTNSKFQSKPGFEHSLKTPSTTTSASNRVPISNAGSSRITTATNTVSQYVYTNAKTTMHYSSRIQERYCENNLAVHLSERGQSERSKQGRRSITNCGGEATAEITAPHCQPIAASLMTNESKRPKVTSNPSNLICRNFPTPNDDSKRKQPVENVRTFAQIVAATKPSAPATKAKNDYFRYHE